MGWWEVTCEPREEQHDIEGVERAPAGLVVHVTDGQCKSVVGRVAYSRSPWRALRYGSFKRSLRRVLARAAAEAEMMNAVERRQREAVH